MKPEPDIKTKLEKLQEEKHKHIGFGVSEGALYYTGLCDALLWVLELLKEI